MITISLDHPLAPRVVAVGGAFALAGCNDFLDVNSNPNVPQTAPPDIVLPAVLATFSTGILGSFPSTMSAEWMQQVSFNSNSRGLRVTTSTRCAMSMRPPSGTAPTRR